MRKLIGLAAVGALVAGTAASALAESDGPNFTFGASTSYTYDINDPDIHNGQNEKLYSNYQSEESFNIDLVQIGASGTRGPVSYGAKVDYGDLANLVETDLGNDDIALQEAYLAVEAGPLVVTAGRIPTPIGYEVLEPWANPNISRSRAWSFQPINHDGLAVSGQTGNFNAMVGVVNGFYVTDPTVNNPDDKYAVLVAGGAAVGDLDLRLSGIWSQENDAGDIWEANGVLAGNYNNCRYGLETTYGNWDANKNSSQWSFWDITLYGGGTWGPWSADLRASYTDELDHTSGNQIAGTDDNGIWSFTATGGYEITDGVVVRAEYRIDAANDDIFADDDTIGGSPDNLDNVVSVQLMWTPATGDKK